MLFRSTTLGPAGRAVASGAVPDGLREQAGAAFASGMNELFTICAVIAALGAVASLALVRSSDLYRRRPPA